MDSKEIMDILPHRSPFLMVDKITELVPGISAVGIKNISSNEPWFTGHFPGNPIMPGVLMVEAMAQVGACVILGEDKYCHQLAYLAGIDHVRFKRLAVPGDTLQISTELIKIRGNIGKAKGKITVQDELVCSGEFLFAIARS